MAWGVQHWSSLAVMWSWVLVLRWRSLGELSLFDITWGREVSGGPVPWIRLSHHGGSGLTPGRSTKTLPATRLGRNGRENREKKLADRIGRQGLLIISMLQDQRKDKHNEERNEKHKREPSGTSRD